MKINLTQQARVHQRLAPTTSSSFGSIFGVGSSDSQPLGNMPRVEDSADRMKEFNKIVDQQPSCADCFLIER